VLARLDTGPDGPVFNLFAVIGFMAVDAPLSGTRSHPSGSGPGVVVGWID
jgi:hypothetical protein